MISKFNKQIRFLLCVINIYSKYAWIKDKKGFTIINSYQKFLNESIHKPNKL